MHSLLCNDIHNQLDFNEIHIWASAQKRQESDSNPLMSPHTVALDIDTEHWLFMVLSSQDRLLGLAANHLHHAH